MRTSPQQCQGPSRCTDAFLVRLSESGGLLFGTVFGGTSMEEARGVAVDPGGGAWIAGTTFSDDLPVTAGALQPARAGGDCPMTYLQQFPRCSDGLLAAFAPGTATPVSAPTPPSGAAPASAEEAASAAAAANAAAANAGSSSSTPAASRPALAARQVTVRRRGRDLTGRLRGDARCVSGARVLLERRASGAWRVVRRARSGPRGHFSVRLPAKRGRYRVRAPAVTRDGVVCGAVRSD